MELSNPQHEAFAQHVAAGLSYTQAALRAGYSPSGANNSGSRLAKNKRVEERIRELKEVRGGPRALGAGIRSCQSRVSAIEDRWDRLRRIVAERALDPDMAEVPGGRTGLLLKQVKQIGSGERAQFVTSFVVDAVLLSELRAHEMQAAEELGQHATRREVYNQSISMHVSDPRQLNQALRSQVAQLPESQREQLVKDAPELADLIEQPEPPAEA